MLTQGLREDQKHLKYSRDCGWPRRPWPNAGRKKLKKRQKNQFFFLVKIKKSSSYAKILCEKLFHTREIPRRGSKAEDGGKRRETEQWWKQWPSYAWRTLARMAHASRLAKRKERLNDGNNNGQATHGARKHAWRTKAAWAKISIKCNYISYLFYFNENNNHKL